jgi:uncharacterized protein (TIGR00251 family)
VGTLADQVCRRSKGGIVLAVRLTPKSSRDEISGVEPYDGNAVLKARVRAVPDKGKANAALEKLIARWLGVPRSMVGLASGGKSRLKSIAVSGDTQELIGLLEDRLAEQA